MALYWLWAFCVIVVLRLRLVHRLHNSVVGQFEIIDKAGCKDYYEEKGCIKRLSNAND